MSDRPRCAIRDTYLIGGRVLHWPGPFEEILSPMTEDGGAAKAGRRSSSAGRPGARIVLGRSPLLGSREALAALKAARTAFASGTGEWPSMTLAERAGRIETFIARLVRRKALISSGMMWEIAKPRNEVEDEFERTAVFMRRILADADTLDRRTSRPKRERGIAGRVRREPLGVALCLGPYNYPMFETMSLVGPALAAGNTVIIKPPRFGMLFFHDMLGDLAGCFPAGAVNVIFGDGQRLVAPLMRSGGIDAFAFIGRAATANKLMSLHPDKNRLKSLLGLEAKNAAVVMADADLEVAVHECLLGALAFNGQRCAAIKIIFVQKKLAKRFLKFAAGALVDVKMGMPWEEGVRITPLAEPERIPFLRAMIADAEKKGAEIIAPLGTAAAGPDGRPYPTVLPPVLVYPVRRGMRLYDEEQFGPVIPVVPFDGLDEPIRYIQGSKFGQQASVFGRDRDEIERFIRAVRTSVARVNVNAKCQRGPDIFPFTGRKDSAQGDLSSPAILEFFSSAFAVTARENKWKGGHNIVSPVK